MRSGEQVCWQSKTEEFPLLEKDAKGLILGKWIGTVVAAAAILGLYFKNNPTDWSKGVVGLILLIAALLVISPFIEKRNVMGQRYWITDQRAILMSKDKTFYSMELADIDEFRLVEGKTAHGTLVLGSKVFEDIDRQLRWRACHPSTDIQSDGAADEAEGLVFFSVSNCDEAVRLLRQRIHQAV